MERSVRDVAAGIYDIITNPRHVKWIAPVLLLIDAVLCALIIRTTNCKSASAFKIESKNTVNILETAVVLTSLVDTEIDWVAYMQQVEQYVSGERDYTMIKGDTGPLVYPAGHVYIHKFLYDLTSQGTNILLAQCIFGAVYIVNEALAMWCYYEAEVCLHIPCLSPILSVRLEDCPHNHFEEKRTRHELIFQDTTLPPTPPDPLQTPPQHLPPPPLQRRLHHHRPLRFNRPPPTTPLRTCLHRLLPRPLRQDEPPPRLTSVRSHPLPSRRSFPNSP